LFLALCFLFKILQGIGAGIVETVGIAILLLVCPPEEVSKYFGILEIFSGLGAMVGLPLGGVLYGNLGFFITFIINTALLLVPIPFIFFVVPSPPEKMEEDEDHLSAIPNVYGYFWVWACAVSVVVGNITVTALNSTFQPHMKEIPGITLSDSAIGGIFLIGPLLYMVTGPVVGHFSNQVGGEPMMLFGLMLCSLGYLLLGPAPFFIWLSNSVWTNSLSLVFIGIGISMTVIPALSIMQEAVLKHHKSQATSSSGRTQIINEGLLNDTLSGVVNAALALGASVGPLLASFLQGEIGFPWAVTAISGLCGLCVFILFGVSLRDLLQFYNRRTPLEVHSEVNSVLN